MITVYLSCIPTAYPGYLSPTSPKFLDTWWIVVLVLGSMTWCYQGGAARFRSANMAICATPMQPEKKDMKHVVCPWPTALQQFFGWTNNSRVDDETGKGWTWFHFFDLFPCNYQWLTGEDLEPTHARSLSPLAPIWGRRQSQFFWLVGGEWI